MEGDLLYEETRFQSFKRTVKTEKGYAGDSVLTQNKLSKGIYILLKKKLVNKMKIFRIPQRTGDFYPAIYDTDSYFTLLYILFCSNTLNV